jgi:hypothetical protein
MNFVDSSGQRFGRLVVLRRTEGRRVRFLCKCDCGKETTVAAGNLRGKNTQSCGCLRKDAVSLRKTKPTIELVSRQVWTFYQRNARIRSISWDISFEDLKKLIFAPCHYCGESGVNATRTSWTARTGARRVLGTNGIDRLDNSQGYMADNCVSCCKYCNFGKNTRSVQEFVKWAVRLGRRLEMTHADFLHF